MPGAAPGPAYDAQDIRERYQDTSLVVFKALRAPGLDSNYLLFGRNRRARLVHNNGNAQSVHARHAHYQAARAPSKGSTSGSTVCTLL